MYTCVYLLEKPFASELETHTTEINVPQVSATLYTFMPNTYAWCGNVANCIQIPLYRIVTFLVCAFLIQICVRFVPILDDVK